MANLTPFLIYVLVVTFTPGPNNLMAMSNAIQFGYRRTLGFLAGIFSGFTLIMLACGLLNVALVSLLPRAHFWLNLAGAVYLTYLGLHTIFSRLPPEPTAEQPARPGLNTFAAGLTLQFLNLKVILYGITVYSLFITAAFQNPLIVALFAPALAAVSFSSTSLWAFGGALFRGFWRRHYRAFSIVMGGFLLYSAAASVWGH